MVYVVSFHNGLDSLWLKFLYSYTFPHLIDLCILIQTLIYLTL